VRLPEPVPNYCKSYTQKTIYSPHRHFIKNYENVLSKTNSLISNPGSRSAVENRKRRIIKKSSRHNWPLLVRPRCRQINEEVLLTICCRTRGRALGQIYPHGLPTPYVRVYPPPHPMVPQHLGLMEGTGRHSHQHQSHHALRSIVAAPVCAAGSRLPHPFHLYAASILTNTRSPAHPPRPQTPWLRHL
jgi:hypothetical protein